MIGAQAPHGKFMSHSSLFCFHNFQLVKYGKT